MAFMKNKAYSSVSARVAAISSFALLTVAGSAWADFGGTDGKVCGFLGSINSLLNMASIAVVTIAVIFAGYQIAFAHKRIADVAPILIGGMLIGAAGQIAKMLIGDSGQACTATDSGAMIQVAKQLLSLYA